MKKKHINSKKRNNSNKTRKQRVVVMTGATSGFGTCTLSHLTSLPNTRVIIGARGSGRSAPAGVEILPLELSSLTSVREFAANVMKQLGDSCIDILILNAGMRGSDAEQRSADGYGLTFAVNHLAHYLLVRLLLSKISEHGRIVLTSSNMHNPPFKSLRPKSLEVEAWAFPTKGGSGEGLRAYSVSKLCNLMTAESLARLNEVKAHDIKVVAFNPGLTGGVSGGNVSKLQKTFFTIITHTLYPLVGLFMPEFVMSKPEHSGKMLADVAMGRIVPPQNSVYVSLVKGKPTFPNPSELAQDRKLQDQLWCESAALVGLE